MLALAHLSLSSGTKTAKRNLKRGLASLKKEGINPTKSESVIDIGAGKKFSCGSVGQCPTLTASRCSSRNYWLTKVWALQLLSGKGTDLNLSFFVEIKLSLTASQPDLEAHRRMTVAEMGRLQGFKPGEVAWKQAATPITARGRHIGNCMSVPVLQEAIRAVLSAAGLMWVLEICNLKFKSICSAKGPWMSMTTSVISTD